MAATKRKISASDDADKAETKKAKSEVPEYHLAPSKTNEKGEIIWPAPESEMEATRAFIKECVDARKTTLIVPDKDADGLTSGAILYHSLTALGLPESLIIVHLLTKGNTVHSEAERELMATHDPGFIFILDQGSRPSQPVISKSHRAIVIDHHHATDTDFPAGAQHINASAYPPVSTSSLLTYLICSPLHESIPEKTAWLACVGTHGDLGNTLKWQPPFPDMTATFKMHTKKAINDAVALVNAPRRTATYDVKSAWDVLLSSSGPGPVLKSSRLHAAKAEVAQETERCTHTAPQFSADARIAVFRISSSAQVHPVIATRWSGTLKSSKLEIILVANSGYLPGKVNFSCRIPKCARGRDPPVNIIESLKSIAREGGEDLVERLGESFARGHKEASGGIVGAEEFEELMSVLKVGGKKERKVDGDGPRPSPKKVKDLSNGQKNTLANYFAKKTGA